MIKVIPDISKSTITLVIGNFFNMYNVKEVDEIWKEEISKNPKTIIIDCASVNSIDSPAIGILVKFKNEASNRNIELILDNMNQPLLNLFQTTQLTKFFLCKTIVKL